MTKRDYLGNFELMVMLALLRLGEDAYGVPILREIEERGGREVALGSVYATLGRLEEKGLVTSKLGEPTPERGGRAKRYFRVTAQGLRVYKLYSRALLALGLGPLWFWWWHYYTYPIIFVPCIGGFLSGWLVARFHRTHRVAMVNMYVISVLLVGFPEFFRLVTNSLSNSRFVPYLLNYSLIESLFVVSILLGGLRSTNTEAARLLHSIARRPSN